MSATSQRTFVLLKPDTVKRGLVGAVVRRFEDRGLSIVTVIIIGGVLYAFSQKVRRAHSPTGHPIPTDTPA